jgi:hypothetical protein
LKYPGESQGVENTAGSWGTALTVLYQSPWQLSLSSKFGRQGKEGNAYQIGTILDFCILQCPCLNKRHSGLAKSTEKVK